MAHQFPERHVAGASVASDSCASADGDVARRADLRSPVPMERERHGSPFVLRNHF
jgi:hypothetical protein